MIGILNGTTTRIARIDHINEGEGSAARVQAAFLPGRRFSAVAGWSGDSGELVLRGGRPPAREKSRRAEIRPGVSRQVCNANRYDGDSEVFTKDKLRSRHVRCGKE